MLQAVAKRYATALFEIALDRDALERFDAQADMLQVVFDDALVRNFFGSPRIGDKDKKGVLDKLFAGKLETELLAMLKLLVDKRRIGYVVPITRYFDHLTDIHRGVEEVTLVSAVELSDAQRQEILAELKRFSDYDNLRVKTEVDLGVIGGVKVQLGDHLVLDGTVSSKLSEMRESLTAFMHRGTGA